MQSHWEVIHGGGTVVATTPQGLWENAAKYFKWCDDNPIENTRTLISGREAGKHVVEVSPRPYSLKGLCLHCGISEEYLRDIRQSQEKDNMYYIVVSKILYIVYVQNLEYATVGVFNPIFTAKILGFEKEETPSGAVKVEIVGGLPELSLSENEVLEKYESEKQNLKNAKEQSA